SRSQAAAGRIVTADAVKLAAPDILIASWCGKKFRPERVLERPGWASVPAVRDGELHEVKSPEILQPGPAALTDGVHRLQAIISGWAERRRAP
ncbi:MAG TPA: ABC transporter substrate-binding protein, partial [Burkholderiales bacterium]|nr:ABC transporter substrate-binding protein [Burkholderiales bacterium]